MYIITIQSILEKFKANNPSGNIELIQKAYQTVEEAHRGQKRKSGEDYIQHCLATAQFLIDLKLDSETIAAALLHDVLDDTDITIQQIEKNFGGNISRLLEGVSKIGTIKYRGAERVAENFRRLFLAMAKDIRVVLIKLADRLHNMQTIAALDQEKQKRIALETLEIYAPIAYRLGMRKISGDLEDLAFPIVYPDKYQWLVQNIKGKYQERENYLKKIQAVLQKQIKKTKINIIDIHSRAKHYYSLYKKLLRYEMDLNKIYDLVALRIITGNVEDCYAVLGLIHKLWKPLPGRIKDYIAVPKPNGYQSLHTTIFALAGKIVEIQIRTSQMHQEAEYGIAAHWYYSEKKGLREYIKRIFTRPPEKDLTWVQQLQDWQKDKFSSPEEFLESLKIDFFKDRIFVLTPKGDVVDLPDGATPVDFAYHIHTDIGHRCVGAKADNKLIPIDQPLLNGQIIEIITQKNKSPNQNWLRFIKTSQAKNKIKHWFKQTEETAIKTIPKTEITEKPSHVSKKIVPKEFTPEIEISGQTKILTYLAHCCQPKPRDEIKGYITLTKGIAVHRANCRNLAKIKNTERLILVSWKNLRNKTDKN